MKLEVSTKINIFQILTQLNDVKKANKFANLPSGILMQLKKLRGVKKERAVRMGMLCRGVWGIWGHLLDVSRDFGTFWNPQKNGCKA